MSLPLFRWVIEVIVVDVRACSPSVNCAFIPPSQTYFLAEFSQRHFCGGYSAMVLLALAYVFEPQTFESKKVLVMLNQ